MAKERVTMGRGKMGFTISRTYRTSLENVWNGATQAKHWKKYFVDTARGDFTPELNPVYWEWKGMDAVDITVTACEAHKFVEFHWRAEAVTYHTRVRIEFSREKGRTLLRITERGWKSGDWKSAFGHCSGWTDFVDYLKAYLIYGLDFRK